MKDKATLGHGSLALVAAIAAGLAAFGPELGTKSDEVVVVPGDAEDLRRITWRDERYHVVLEPAGEATDRLRVRVQAAPRPTPTSEGEAEKPADEAPKIYPASASGKELFEAMAPLRAPRSLGVLAPDALAPMGLDAPRERLEIELASGTHTVEIGDAMYGSGDRYARTESGEVFLLAARTLSPLRNGGAQIVERRVLPIEPEAVRRVRLTAGDDSRDAIHRHPEERGKAFYADPAVPDEKLAQLGNWIDRVLRLRVVDFADAPPEGAPAMTVEIRDASDALGTFSLWPASERTAVATSSFFADPVTISKANAEAVLRDVEAVLGEGR